MIQAVEISYLQIAHGVNIVDVENNESNNHSNYLDEWLCLFRWNVVQKDGVVMEFWKLGASKKIRKCCFCARIRGCAGIGAGILSTWSYYFNFQNTVNP